MNGKEIQIYYESIKQICLFGRMRGNKEIETKQADEKTIIPVYNYVSGPQNPLTWSKLIICKC